MPTQSNGANNSVTVVPFAPAFQNAASDQLDSAGQTILNVLHNAANFAEANYQHALDAAQKLSHQLRAAEARIAELEGVGQAYQERAERAEQWLLRVCSEIEDRFLKRVDRRGAVTREIEQDVIRCVEARLAVRVAAPAAAITSPGKVVG